MTILQECSEYSSAWRLENPGEGVSLVPIRIAFPAPGPHWVSGFGVRPMQASGFNDSPDDLDLFTSKI